ncbi:hypothetical protein [Salinibacillus xinjiangensis]|uniref:Uncharacterized protein n=1 Tax=Salinibacillus xinjiangensis TaxID=1229268 RepID=A0A6G1X846_9BACI|nr:hypothetical protein [Salinibacillus xinjiangensis]MRG87117.1 hypothetical protein [Salinibacillus xinjiangensis]
MFKVIVVVLIAVVVFLLDFATVKKSKSKKDKKVYIAFFILALSIVVLHVMEVNIPTPIEGIKQIYQPVAEPIRKSLEKYL